MTAFNPDRAKAIDWLSNTGGYNVLAPEFFDGILPPETIRRLTVDHAGGEGKYAITKGGKTLETCIGVSEFAAVDALAHQVGVAPCRMFSGRGKRFRETAAAVLLALRFESAATTLLPEEN